MGVIMDVIHTVPEIDFNRKKLVGWETILFHFYRVSGCAWICFQNLNDVAFFAQGHSRSLNVMHTQCYIQTPVQLPIFYL